MEREADMTSDAFKETAAIVNGERVSLQHILRHARRHQRMDFIDLAIESVLVRQAAVQLGIKVDDDELQEAADRFRSERGLESVEQTGAWLSANHLSVDDLADIVEDELLRQKVRDELTGKQVEAYYHENQRDFDTVALSRLLVEDEGIARELHLLITEEGEDFSVLAREYSIEMETCLAGGYAGYALRVQLEPEVARIVFDTPAGEMCPPVRVSAGWQVTRVEDHRPARLDEVTLQIIKEKLFRDWLTEQHGKVEIPLLEAF